MCFTNSQNILTSDFALSANLSYLRIICILYLQCYMADKNRPFSQRGRLDKVIEFTSFLPAMKSYFQIKIFASLP